MTINKVYDIRLSFEEYQLLNELFEVKKYLVSFGEEMVLLLTEDNLDELCEEIDSYLYSEDTIKGSETYRELKELYCELYDYNYNC